MVEMDRLIYICILILMLWKINFEKLICIRFGVIVIGIKRCLYIYVFIIKNDNW